VSRLLIVEDEARIAAFLERGLRAAGYTTTTVASAATAASVARDDAFDLVVLDLGLPDGDGVEVLAALRARGEKLPVLILTARDDVGARVQGLDGGADDYVTKPFHFDELLARIRARLRDAATEPTSGRLQAGGLELDLHARVVVDGHRRIELTAREFALAETFFRHPDQVLSREQLLDRVWGYDFDPGSNVVEVYVRYLRRKLGEARIETVRGMGYRFRTAGVNA
jgi:DNA-binding response OmpR family regulator